MGFLQQKFEKLPVYGWTIVVIVALVVVSAFAVADWAGLF